VLDLKANLVAEQKTGVSETSFKIKELGAQLAARNFL
jgi:hypothetical protein